MHWRIDAAGQTIVLASEGAVPAVVYWGARLPDTEDLAEIAGAALYDLTGGMLDALPALSLTPDPAKGWAGAPGLVMAEADGTPLSPSFVLTGTEPIPGGVVFSCAATGKGAGLTLRHSMVALPQGLILLRSELTADRPVRVTWLAAPVLPAPPAADILDFSGKWTREFQMNRTPFAPGQRVREARGGRSGQEHPPYAILSEPGCTNTEGTAYGFAYAWSGGHRMVAEEVPDGRRQIQFGHATGAETEARTHFASADLLVGVSSRGLNGIAGAFQTYTRDHLVPWPDPARPRPVHYNCWEAVYFKHDLHALSDIATRAAALGAERFVLDDGWFGQRDDDKTSLGDWTVDRRKWPNGLHPLISHVYGLGMTFGLWVEPEMVNPDSDLYRAHADWALGPADQTLGRGQMVLNLALPEVRDHLFAALDALLSEYPIEYLKWDHNRLLPAVDAGQTRGVYDLLSRLCAAHPTVEIESCASGGGRIDAGILEQTHRVWLSDSNDALERLAIQHDAALFLPAAVTGSHVGPRHCHTSGRTLSMSFRAWVAAQRHMGFEMDLRELTGDEAATLQKVTAWWKANRHWTMSGTIHRLDAADPAVTAEVQIAADGHRFVVFTGQARTSAQMLPRPLRLAGLDPVARYTVTLVNSEDLPRQSRGPNALKAGPLTLSGRALMTQGLLLPVAWPATMWVVEGVRL